MRLFFAKILVVVGLAVIGYLNLPEDFYSRFRILADVQIGSSCLPYDILILDKKARFTRGDVVAAHIPRKLVELNPGTEKIPYVAKILVAEEGDIVSIRGHKVLVNGNVVSKYSTFLLNYMNEKHLPYVDQEFIVPSGKAYLMGSSFNAVDSRVFGLIDRTDIEGKAYAIL